jgi:hypothetical protein
MTDTFRALCAELRHFVAEYQQMRGLDRENIYSIHQGIPEKEAHLRVSRLTLAADLLERLAQTEPEPGEVAELVKRLRDWRSIPLLQERERIATLLQQLSAPATVAVPVVPTDEDLRGIFSRFCDYGDNGRPWIESEEFIQAARAVLARWGQQAATPIPVAERLPGPEDLNGILEECWWYDHACWYLDTYQANYTHWLPANALPMPAND